MPSLASVIIILYNLMTPLILLNILTVRRISIDISSSLDQQAWFAIGDYVLTWNCNEKCLNIHFN